MFELNINKSEILNELTLKEKIALLSGNDTFSLKGVTRLGIPYIKITSEFKGNIMSGKAGIANHKQNDSTCFPAACLCACSFDRELLKDLGEAIAKECISNEISAYILSGAVLDSAYFGRSFDLLSENEYLTAELASAMAVGLQSYGIAAVICDFAVYCGETDKWKKDILIREKDLHEKYLKPFEMIIKKASPKAVILSCNKVNGTYTSENSYLLNVLLHDWEFGGIVISDWGGINDRVKALNCGVHIEMPSSNGYYDGVITESVEKDEISVELIDKRLLSILKFIRYAKDNRKSGYKFDKAFNRKLSERIAEESIVLLKNDNNTLPLSPNDVIAVVGNAINPCIQAKGSSYRPVDIFDDPLQSIRDIATSLTGSNILYAKGYDEKSTEVREDLVYEACRTVMDAKAVILFLGMPESDITEGKDRTDLSLPQNQVDLIDSIYQYNKNITVVVTSASHVTMPWIDKVNCVLDAKVPGEGFGPAIANIIFGIINPSGKLSCTYSDNSFPFGFGLSYTDFEYSDLYIDYAEKEEEYIVSFIIQNTGNVFGKEVIQLYSQRHEKHALLKTDNVDKINLTGFCKIGLSPKEKQKVTFNIKKNSFRVYHPETNYWKVESGEYEFMVASSSEDIRLSAFVYIEGDDLIEHGYVIEKSVVEEKYTIDDEYTLNSTVNEMLNSPRGKRLYPICFKWANRTMGLDKDNPNFIMNMEMFLNTPVKTLALMSGEALTLQRLQGLIDMCNGKTIRGISKMLL